MSTDETCGICPKGEIATPSNPPDSPLGNDIWKLFRAQARSDIQHRNKLAHVAEMCNLSHPEAEQAISAFQDWLSASAGGSPRSEHLLVLVKFNVFRALIDNSKTLGYATDHGMDDDALSPFPGASDVVKYDLKSRLPVALHPTELQCRIQHHPWIDMLPFPEMRDNLLLAGDNWDEDELCGDLVGLFSTPTGRTGLVVWGEPWDIRGWEVTEAFLRVWGWTIRGSSEIVKSTNFWRAKRGEKPLSFNNSL